MSKSGQAVAYLIEALCYEPEKKADLISDEFILIFHCHNPSAHTMIVGSTQPVTETSTRNLSCGIKAAGALDLQSYHLHVPNFFIRPGNLSLLEL